MLRSAFVFLLLCGCGPSAGGTVTCESARTLDTYKPNLEHSSPSGKVRVALVAADPEPPARGNNSWTLKLMDASGAPLPSAAPTVSPYMPEHGHGTSVTPQVTDNGDGTFSATPLYLFMPGLWQLTVAPAAGSSADDSVAFYFCIAG